MRTQKVSVDMWKMIYASFSYLFLAFAVYVFLKLVTSCFWLPTYLKNNNENTTEKTQQQDDNDIADEIIDHEEDKKNV